MRTRVFVGVLAVAGLLLLGQPAGAEPAQPNGNGYVCWNDQGYPIPQAGSECPPGWHGAPATTTTTAVKAAGPVPVPVLEVPVPVRVAAAFTG